MENLRAEFQHLKETRSLTQSDVARGTGLSTATVSQWLRGEYTGDVESTEAKIQSFFEIVRERDPLARKSLEFVETSVSKIVFEVSRSCHRDGVIGLCTGPSGIGKTRAIKEYQSKNAGVILIEAHCAYRTRDVIADLHRAVGLSGEGTVHRMLRDLVEKLKRTGRLIIVDESEHLKSGTLDELRRLNDWCGVGLLYVGLDRFREQIAALRSDFAYITNRIRIPASLRTLKLRDTEALVMTMLPEANGLCKVYHQECGGNTRKLEALLYNTLRMAEHNSVDVDADMIRQASQQLTV